MLLYLAAGLAAAAISRKIAKRLSLPVITGYILIGIALGVSFLNILKPEVLSRLGLVSDIAMSLIAFTIGAELNLKKFSNLGKSILFIAICESLGAFLFVFGVLIVMNPSKPANALILGSIASATAPAATVTGAGMAGRRGVLILSFPDGAWMVPLPNTSFFPIR